MSKVPATKGLETQIKMKTENMLSPAGTLKNHVFKTGMPVPFYIKYLVSYSCKFKGHLQFPSLFNTSGNCVYQVTELDSSVPSLGAYMQHHLMRGTICYYPGNVYTNMFCSLYLGYEWHVVDMSGVHCWFWFLPNLQWFCMDCVQVVLIVIFLSCTQE